MATLVTIPGANGVPLVFKITGTSSANYGLAFQSEVGGVSTSNIRVLSSGDSQIPSTGVTSGIAPTTFAHPDAPAAGPVLNEIFSNSTTPTYTLLYGSENTLIDVGSSTTLVGSAGGGDTVVATGVATYDATGDFNNVDFFEGENTYNGGTATGDTVTAGSGYDLINAGTGYSTVFGGGHSTIVLNDTVGANGDTPGGLVYLGDGTSTVDANGSYDDVVTGTNGQTIFGSSVAGGTLNVVIGDNATSSGAAGNLIVANASTTNVFDSVGGSSIFGGSGILSFVGGAAAGGVMSDTIVGGSGSTFLYGSDGDSISFAGDTSGSVATFTAGLGNETLNAANADGRVDFFGSNDISSTATFVGSTTGFNYFQTGGNAVAGTDTPGSGGAESLVGGAGTNIFGIADGGSNAHITVFDFAAGNDSVNFLGETQDQINADLSSATVGSINGESALTLTLSDQTTVTFVGITSLTGHVIGGGTGT